MALFWSNAASKASRFSSAAPSIAEREGFRPEVQGLRALAVISVVLFHLWPKAVPGGFVGVDVFFVISGYLITGYLFRELQQTGRISLLQFYIRRAKRLLPAASLVLIVVALATPLMPPASWHNAWRSIIASAFYVENWYLAGLAVDYLAAEDAPTAVQHYWSLSIEEQFYLIWPLIMIGASTIGWRSRSLRQRLLVPLSVITALSLGASIWLTEVDPAAAYFVTHTRIWELGLGALIAIARTPNFSMPMRETMRSLGLAMIFIAIFGFNGQTPFPGYAALLPTAGCGLLLAAGSGAGRWSVTQPLTWRPAQYVGDISYSMYLWHWPLLIFAGFYAPEEIGASLVLGLLALTIILSGLTKRFVEDPIRYCRLETREILGLTTIAVASCVAAAAVIYEHTGLQAVKAFEDSPDYPGARAILQNIPVPKVDAPMPPLVLVTKDKAVAYDKGCHLGSKVTAPSPCVFGPLGGPRVVLMGDSHAANWIPALMVVAEEEGWRLETHTKSDCMVLRETIKKRNGPYAHCREWSEKLLAQLRNSPPQLVILTQHRFHQLARSSGETAEAIGAALAVVWRDLRDMGIPVIAILDIPWLAEHPENCILRDLNCAMDETLVLQGEDPIRIAQRLVPSVGVIDMNDTLCRGGKCPMIIGNIVVWRDPQHLTASYSRSTSDALKQRLFAALKYSGGLPHKNPHH